MKKVVPFTKTINFKNMIAEIEDIEVNHNLELKNDNEVEGDILLDGKYKMTTASNIVDSFHYRLPFVIAIDTKYDTTDLDISIADFNYEIINEESLKVDVSIELDGLVDTKLDRNNEIEIPIEELDSDIKEVDTPIVELSKKIEEEIDVETMDNIKKENSETNIGSIFSSLASNDETFSTYHVYIVRELDTIDTICDKYNVTKELLSNYNDLTNIEIGDKLIIPANND